MVLAGVREIKPLYVPKIIEPDSTSIVTGILLPVLYSSPLHMGETKTVPSSKKSFKNFVAHRNDLFFSLLTKCPGDTDWMRKKGILERKSQAMNEGDCYHF